MPSFDQYPESDVVKMLPSWRSVQRQNGSFCLLGAAGYNVRILDLDRKARIIKDYVTNPDSPYRNASPPLWTAESAAGVAKRMSYVNVDETISQIGANLVAKGDSWGKISNQFNDWKDNGISYGNISTWTPNDVLVIDSLSKAARAAMYYQLALNGRAVSGPQMLDWNFAQGYVETMLLMLAATNINCHVIIICHIDYIEKDDGSKIARGMVQTLGKKLSPKLGQHFSHALMVKDKKIHTRTTGVVDLVSSAPLKVQSTYPIETGLAAYFRDVLGKGPQQGAGK